MATDFKKNILPLRPELLSPAGSWASLKAAIENGADAVYLGSREFNARIYAHNFSLDELEKVIRYSHENGVRIYLTVNTLVKNHEVSRFFNVISRAYVIGVDGVIIQHISFLDPIKSNFPDLKVFISTQAAIGNTAGASLVKSADRLILPRELPLKEIQKIVDGGMQVEVFVHGALCFSYSGLCLFSSFVGNRSGNRGSCAQLCRQKYDGSYPLSTKELCLVRRIPELIKAGITGFKIEGRMRSPLYVAVTTRLYRKAIDSFIAGKFLVPEKELREIEVVFNREFTEGFAFNNKDLISSEKPMNRGALLGMLENGEITLQRMVGVGDGVGIWNGNEITGGVVENIRCSGKAVASASVGDRVQLGIQAKNGSIVYLTSSLQINVRPDFTVKRSPVELKQRKPVHVHLPHTNNPNNTFEPRLLVKAYSLSEAIESIRAGAYIVFYNIFAGDFPGKNDWREQGLLGAFIPRIMNDDELSESFDLLQLKRPSAILSGNAGFLVKRDEYKIPTFLDYTFNTFNDPDSIFLRKYQSVAMLSPELSLKEMIEFKNKDTVILCHADVVVANTLIPLQNEFLIDEKGSSI